MRYWDKDKITEIATTCVILHNMAVEDKGRAICTYHPGDELNPQIRYQMGDPEYLDRLIRMQDRDTNYGLREDLSHHLWNNRN
jgi:hypothetical protein